MNDMDFYDALNAMQSLRDELQKNSRDRRDKGLNGNFEQGQAIGVRKCIDIMLAHTDNKEGEHHEP